MGNFAEKETYTKGNLLVPAKDGEKLFSMYEGKIGARSVSIFIFLKKNRSKNLLDAAQNVLQQMKTIRHPFILKFLDSLDSEQTIFLVTEEAIPLSTVAPRLSYSEICLGVVQITEALVFLHCECRRSHNNVAISNIYVNPADKEGWRLGGFEFVLPPPTHSLFPYYSELKMYRLTLPEDKKGETLSYSRDVWGLGNLLLDLIKSCKDNERITKIQLNEMESAARRLVVPNPKDRPAMNTLLSTALSAMSRDPLCRVVCFLQSIALKSEDEKDVFFRSLSTQLEQLSVDILKRLVLPRLLSPLLFMEPTIYHCVPSLFTPKNSTPNQQKGLLPLDEYLSLIIPFVISLFGSRDSTTRCLLLKHVNSYYRYLTTADLQYVVNELLLGLKESKDEIVLSSLSALSEVFDYALSNPNSIPVETVKAGLEEVRKLGRGDSKEQVRSSSLLVIVDILCSHHSTLTKENYMKDFYNALIDESSVVRKAAIEGIGKLKSVMDPLHCVKQIIPAVLPSLLDGNIETRQRAKSVVLDLISSVSTVADSTQRLPKDLSTSTFVSTSRTASIFKALKHPKSIPNRDHTALDKFTKATSVLQRNESNSINLELEEVKKISLNEVVEPTEEEEEEQIIQENDEWESWEEPSIQQVARTKMDSLNDLDTVQERTKSPVIEVGEILETQPIVKNVVPKVNGKQINKPKEKEEVVEEPDYFLDMEPTVKPQIVIQEDFFRNSSTTTNPFSLKFNEPKETTASKILDFSVNDIKDQEETQGWENDFEDITGDNEVDQSEVNLPKAASPISEKSEVINNASHPYWDNLENNESIELSGSWNVLSSETTTELLDTFSQISNSQSEIPPQPTQEFITSEKGKKSQFVNDEFVKDAWDTWNDSEIERNTVEGVETESNSENINFPLQLNSTENSLSTSSSPTAPGVTLETKLIPPTSGDENEVSSASVPLQQTVMVSDRKQRQKNVNKTNATTEKPKKPKKLMAVRVKSGFEEF